MATSDGALAVDAAVGRSLLDAGITAGSADGSSALHVLSLGANRCSGAGDDGVGVRRHLGFAYGLRYVELGILVAFATQYSSIRFWPGIPAWGLAGIIVGMAMLQAISNRTPYEFVLTVTMAFLAPLMLRALGHAEQHEWIPKFPLPAKLAGGPYHRPPTRHRKRSQPRQRSTHLSSVPPPPPPPGDVAAQAKIDALLDKMGEHGLESLTEAERRTLEDLSKRLRDRRDRS